MTWRVREREKTSQSEAGGPSSSMELIAIPNGLAGCKRKIEFDRCHWEREKAKKERERKARGRPGVARRAYWVHTCSPFVGRKESKGKGTGFSPEGRKEGSRAIRDGKSNQLGKDRDISRWERERGEMGRVRLRTFGDNYRRADSIPHYVCTGKRIALSIKASLQGP